LCRGLSRMTLASNAKHGGRAETNERRAKRATPRGEVWIDRVREV